MATFWLKYGLKMAEVLPIEEKARVLMFIGHMAAMKGQFIKAEGLFKTCEEMLKTKVCFERVHMYNLLGDML